jgi:hypothetical protein
MAIFTEQFYYIPLKFFSLEDTYPGNASFPDIEEGREAIQAEILRLYTYGRLGIYTYFPIQTATTHTCNSFPSFLLRIRSVTAA